MRAALAALPGVRHVNVDFEKKQAVVTVTEALDSQKLVAALEDAGFGGAVKAVRSVSAESADSNEPDGAADAPPLPGLSVDERELGAAKTTYSSTSFAEHVQVSTYLDHDVLRPGDSFRIAVVLDIDDGWHIYGNPLGPGIGKETVVSVEGQDGFKLGPARYAPAHRQEQNFGEAGKTWVWEHTERTVHFLSGKVSDATEPGEYQLMVEASAQVCTKSACLPGKSTTPLPVTIIVADALSNPLNGELFENFDRASVP